MAVRHVGVTLDCVDLGRIGRFWSQALGFDGVERQGDYLLLRGQDGRSGLTGFTLQQVPESKLVKNRMHLDLVVDQVEAEVDRLESLGAAGGKPARRRHPEIAIVARWACIHHSTSRS